jgi:cellulose synthase/poly-beta-1,6-N-acetylglucosamine synthase-like glycosyltransferase
MGYEMVFWLCVLGVFYTYFCYPFLLFSFSWIKRRFMVSEKVSPFSTDDSVNAPVAVVIAAFNEEKHILKRVENLLNQDYEQDSLTIYSGSDGSDDKTCELIESLAHPRVRLFPFKQRRGKVAVLNDLISTVNEPIIVMSDANTHFSSSAISHLVRHFDNANIGAVCGELELVEVDKTDNKDNLYWKYEQFLKDHEGVLSGLLGANGGIYAFRQSLYQSLPSDTIIDDFTIVMRIALSGYKVIYDQNARATEEIAPTLSDEYKRRVRIGMGNYQAMVRLHAALNPKHGWLWFTYLSHKVGRWLVPHAMLLTFFCSLMLSNKIFYAAILLAQISIYFLVWLTPKIFSQNQIPSSIAILSFFIKMNIALGHGFIKWSLPGCTGVWVRTPR